MSCTRSSSTANAPSLNGIYYDNMLSRVTNSIMCASLAGGYLHKIHREKSVSDEERIVALKSQNQTR